MQKPLFLRIVEVLSNHGSYFQMRSDASSKMGLSPLQKCIATIHILAYGSLADSVDEYIINTILISFCKGCERDI